MFSIEQLIQKQQQLNQHYFENIYYFNTLNDTSLVNGQLEKNILFEQLKYFNQIKNNNKLIKLDPSVYVLKCKHSTPEFFIIEFNNQYNLIVPLTNIFITGLNKFNSILDNPTVQSRIKDLKEYRDYIKVDIKLENKSSVIAFTQVGLFGLLDILNISNQQVISNIKTICNQYNIAYGFTL